MVAINQKRSKMYAAQTANILKHRCDVTGLKWKRKPGGLGGCRGMGPKIMPENMAKAIEGSCGVVSRIARRLGCTNPSVRAYLKRPGNEVSLALYNDEMESFVDHAEAAVKRSMDQKDDPRTVLNAARFVLQTKGKDRGWKKESTVNVQGSMLHAAAVVDLTSLNLPIEYRRDLLNRIEAAGAEVKTIDAPKLLPAPEEKPKIQIAPKGKITIRKRMSA